MSEYARIIGMQGLDGQKKYQLFFDQDTVGVILPAVLELINIFVDDYRDWITLQDLMNHGQLSQVCALFNLAVEANQHGLQVSSLKTSHSDVVDAALKVFRPFVQQLNSDDSRWLTHPID